MQLSRTLNRKIGRAMHDYGMLADGDRVLVAVSGGIDSLVLLAVLHHWQKKAPIEYELCPLHVDMEPEEQGAGRAARAVASQVNLLGLQLQVLPALYHPDPTELAAAEAGGQDLCFQCARSRRTQLFAYARDHGYNSLALGHHRDDIIETFLLNLTCAGNISTMSPKQTLFSGRLHLIRPLSYLDKAEIEPLGEGLGFAAVRSACPLAEKTRRLDIHELAEHIYAVIPGAKEHLFAALGNVRSDYLLKQTGGRRP